MVEKMKISRENVVILTDSLKGFECICHDLLITKLNAYEFDRNDGGLSMINSVIDYKI